MTNWVKRRGAQKSWAEKSWAEKSWSELRGAQRNWEELRGHWGKLRKVETSRDKLSGDELEEMRRKSHEQMSKTKDVKKRRQEGCQMMEMSRDCFCKAHRAAWHPIGTLYFRAILGFNFGTSLPVWPIVIWWVDSCYYATFAGVDFKIILCSFSRLGGNVEGGSTISSCLFGTATIEVQNIHVKWCWMFEMFFIQSFRTPIDFGWKDRVDCFFHSMLRFQSDTKDSAYIGVWKRDSALVGLTQGLFVHSGPWHLAATSFVLQLERFSWCTVGNVADSWLPN